MSQQPQQPLLPPILQQPPLQHALKQPPIEWHQHTIAMRFLHAQLCQLERDISTAKAQYNYRMLESIESYLTYIKGQISNNNNRAEDIAVQLVQNYFQKVGNIECRYKIYSLDNRFYELSRPAIEGFTDVINCLRDRSVTDEFCFATARFLVSFVNSATNPGFVTVFEERTKTYFDRSAGLVMDLLKPQA